MAASATRLGMYHTAGCYAWRYQDKDTVRPEFGLPRRFLQVGRRGSVAVPPCKDCRVQPESDASPPRRLPLYLVGERDQIQPVSVQDVHVSTLRADGETRQVIHYHSSTAQGFPLAEDTQISRTSVLRRLTTRYPPLGVGAQLPPDVAVALELVKAVR